MSFPALPTELILEICASNWLEIPDIASVIRTNRFLRDLLTAFLYSLPLKERSDKYCKSLLYHAAKRQDHSTVKFLLDSGVLDIIKSGRMILNHAVCVLSEEAITTLLDCGVNPNSRDARERTPLICATTGQFSGAVRALLKHPRVEVNLTWLISDFTAFHLAIRNGWVEMVRLFLACPRVAVNKINRTWREPADTFSYKVHSELLGASLCGQVVSVEVPLRRGWAPLHMAVHCGNPAILSMLLDDERIDVNIVNIRNESALHMAVFLEREWEVHLLMAHPKVQAQKDNRSILCYAVACAKLPMIQLLLGYKKVDVSWLNGWRRATALHYALSRRRLDIVRAVLRRNDIDIGEPDGFGVSPRDMVCTTFPRVARILNARQITLTRRLRYLDLAIEYKNCKDGEWGVSTTGLHEALLSPRYREGV